MEFQLSKRLAAIARRLNRGSVLADIGSDHALLPIHAVNRGISKGAVAGELNEGPFRRAQANVAAAGLSGRIDVRKGDGLAVIAPGEADQIVIAGMGGATMTAILTAGSDRLTGVNKLLLQPNVGAPLLRRWLQDNGWLLQDECVVEEDGLHYEILEARPVMTDRDEEQLRQLYASFTLPGDFPVTAGLQLEMGPHLLRRPSSAFFRMWQAELAKRESIIRRMRNARQADAVAKRQMMEQETNVIREVLSCLPMAKPSSS